MPGGVLATSGEVGKASEEACGVLTVSNKIAPAAPKRRARGGKASRARRLENFRQHKAAAPAAAPAIKWEQLAHGLLRQQRATLRDGARAAWVRMRAARAKIGAAVRSAWRCRSLEITGIYIERDGVRQYVTGEKVAPLSRRDVYILSRAADRVWWSWNYFGFNEFDPESDRFYRHVRDWLRMETDDGAPHWVHSLRAVQAEQDSEYSSDEDECTSDQDDRGPAYESDDDDGYDRIANDDLDALMRCFDDEDAALIALARHLESLPPA